MLSVQRLKEKPVVALRPVSTAMLLAVQGALAVPAVLRGDPQRCVQVLFGP